MNKQFLLITVLATTTVVNGSERLGRAFEAFATFANAFASSQTTGREITSGMPSMSKEDRKKHRDNLQPQQLPCPRTVVNGSERLSGVFTALETFANAFDTNNNSPEIVLANKKKERKAAEQDNKKWQAQEKQDAEDAKRRQEAEQTDRDRQRKKFDKLDKEQLKREQAERDRQQSERDRLRREIEKLS